MAAVLACGERATLSHTSAAALWRLLREPAGPVHISLPSYSGRERRAGIEPHRRGSRAEGFSVTRHKGIPVTTPAQTIADLAGVISPAQHRRAIRQAEALGLRTGLASTERTRSELEHLFLRLCERHRIPKPEINVRVGPYEVDFLWRAERFIVETNGYRYHRGSQAFEDDHARELELHSRGYTIHSFTYRQVTKEPHAVAAVVHEALRRSRP